MVCIIVAITGGAIYFADEAVKNGEQERRYLEFRAELGEIGGRLKAQQAMVFNLCSSLAQSVRIMAAMEEGDPAEVYRNAAPELREVLSGDQLESITRARYFGFFDRNGEVLFDADVAAEGDDLLNAIWFEKIRLLETGELPSEQQMGLVNIGDPRDPDSLVIVVITPVVSTWSAEPVGAILLGFEPIILREDTSAGESISGIYFNNHFYLEDGKSEFEGAINRSISGNADTITESNKGTQLVVDGISYLAFARDLPTGMRFANAKRLIIFPIQKSIARRHEQRKTIALAGGGAIAIGLLLSLFLSRQLTKPVEKLAAQSRQDEEGRERAEVAWAASERKYQSLFYNATEGIFALTAGGQLASANPSLADICGFRTPMEMLDLGPSLPARLFADPIQFHSLLQRTLLETSVDGFETLWKLRDGREAYVSINLRKITTPGGGDSYHFEGSLNDISEQRRAARKLQSLNAGLEKALAELKGSQDQVIQQERLRALGEMASGVAHDFNNALTPILGYAQLLQDEKDLTPEIRATYLNTICTAASDGASVVKRLKEFYKPNSIPEKLLPLDLGVLLEETITLTKPRWSQQAQTRGVTVEIGTDFAENLPMIAGDAPTLREVFTNLIFNAVDAMPEGGKIWLRTRYIDGIVVAEVIDTGMGMTEDIRRQCLEPFFSTKGEHGTGLGLSTTFGIVQRHQGTIDIRSKIGSGTAFILSFPPSAEQELEIASIAEVPTPVAGGKLRILVVDDEVPIRMLLTTLLIKEGHEVEAAGSGLDALKVFGDGDGFELVITDKAMPGMSGDQLAVAVKERRPDIPLILLTGFGQFLDDDGIPGVDVIASKPISMESLRDAVAEAIRTPQAG